VIYEVPKITGRLQKRLDRLAKLSLAVGDRLDRPARWVGALRREVRASAIESSTSIEGFSVGPGEAVALTGGEDPGTSENRLAVAGYARAMDHVGVLTADPAFRWSDRVILDLHFDACHFQRDRNPGSWRTGPVGVTGADGSLEFRGPDAESVPGLMKEVIEWLEHGDSDADVFVRAAMAHLHVTSVHPFRDGNGRVSRIVQSLVLARGGMTSPEFFSIEEHLGSNTAAYYAALRNVQRGAYNPERDASEWIGFCIEAHISQAEQRGRQIEAAADRWERLEALVEARRWPERLVIAMEQSLMGGVDRRSYGEEAGVSPATASGDFRRLVDAGLVEQLGRGRNIRYEASSDLQSVIAPA
jgi:Fic family protein